MFNKDNKDESNAFLENMNNSKLMGPKESDLNSKRLTKIQKQLYPICIKLTLFAVVVLLVALTTLTIVREVQIAKLRDDVDFLRRDLKEFRDTVMEDGYLDELKTFETDDELNKLPTGPPMSVDEDQGIDDDQNTDDDTYGNTDDLYDDDTDFLGEVMEGSLADRSQWIDDIQPPIKKVIRVLKPSPEDEQIYNRSRRNVIAQTPDGVPIIEEPYRVARARNISHFIPPQNLRRIPDSDEKATGKFHGWDDNRSSNVREVLKRKHFKKYDESSTASPGSVYTRASRVMVTDEDKSKSFRRVIRFRRPKTRSGLTADYDAAFLEKPPNTSDQDSEHRIRRRYRSESRRLRNLRENVEILDQDKPARSNGLLIAHFNGDTKDYVIGHHEHYDGNGRLRHPHDVPYTAWSGASWLKPLNMDTKFPIEDGSVSVPETGVYFIYAQVYFHDEHDTNGYRIFKNNGVKDEVLLQCTTMTHSTTRIEKSNTCYTAGAFYLNRGDGISLKNIGSMRYSIMESGKSFFGLFKLSSMKIK